MMANRALTSLALWLAVASAAQAQLFGGDDEARRAIIDLRGRIDLMSRELGAQMKEYADRLDALEAATRGQLALRSELDAMRQELARLRGSLEEQTNELANTQKMLRDQSAEFSERLRPIEPVAVQIDGKSVTVSPSERRRFEAAVTAFRERDFKLAQATLQSFRTQYPDSPYMANALFWLGSTQFELKDFKASIESQQTLLTRFPASERAPDAMLSLAYAQIESGDRRSARRTLEQLIEKFPEAPAAKSARDRLVTLPAAAAPAGKS